MAVFVVNILKLLVIKSEKLGEKKYDCKYSYH